jgi:hypothetical protein
MVRQSTGVTEPRLREAFNVAVRRHGNETFATDERLSVNLQRSRLFFVDSFATMSAATLTSGE